VATDETSNIPITKMDWLLPYAAAETSDVDESRYLFSP
jgi:hypothetical protein